MRRRVIQLYIKKQNLSEVIFCLAWNISLLITKKFLFWIFWRWKIWYFEPKSWWRYDIYWLLKISCFNPFGNVKYGFFLTQKGDGKMLFTEYWKGSVLNFSVMGNTAFFWVKKVMERWYLLVTDKFLFWTFWWWKIQSFLQPKCWSKDDIYMAFLSFLWYSRIWEIWLFAQCTGELKEHHQRRKGSIKEYSKRFYTII